MRQLAGTKSKVPEGSRHSARRTHQFWPRAQYNNDVEMLDCATETKGFLWIFQIFRPFLFTGRFWLGL